MSNEHDILSYFSDMYYTYFSVYFFVPGVYNWDGSGPKLSTTVDPKEQKVHSVLAVTPISPPKQA